MRGKVNLCAFVTLLSNIVQLVCSVFLHEPSYVTLNPTEPHTTDFGFSLAYQKTTKRLITGAPNEDKFGKIYTCPMEILKRQITCNEVPIDIEMLAKSTRGNDTTSGQSFCLGASIAATSDYFLSCAPLWTTQTLVGKNTSVAGAFGTCFVFNDTAYRYNGLIEQDISGYKPPYSGPRTVYPFYGGVGWTTVLDDASATIVVSKPALGNDISFVDAQRPFEPAVSLYVTLDKNKKTYLSGHTNMGYAVTFGNFFHPNKTYVAINMDRNDRTSLVAFLSIRSTSDASDIKPMFVYKRYNKRLELSSDEVGSMFGTALCSALLDYDVLSDLVVGAPAQGDRDRGGYETGAVYIYLGGNEKIFDDPHRAHAIIGTKDGSWFGATIAASDIDGDGLSEIIVSAPFEDAGVGAVYVLSGFEIHNKLIKRATREMSLSDFILGQRIQRGDSKTFGFSLQVVPDLDGNGCNELVVGAPGSGSATLFRCLPTVNVSVETKLIEPDRLKDIHKQFVVNVCVSLNYNLELKNTTTKLKVSNEVKGKDASIPASEEKDYILVLSEKGKNCANSTVKLNDERTGMYRFSTNVTLAGDAVNGSDFTNTMVTLSPFSKTEYSVELRRVCDKEYCVPNLNIAQIKWTGRLNSKERYVLGSTRSETITVRVRNAGSNAYDACVMVRVQGARVSRTDCARDAKNSYRCYLPKPLRKDEVHSITLNTDMSKMSNNDKFLTINASLFEDCNKEKIKDESFAVFYSLNPEDIVVKSSYHEKNITDTQLLDTELKTISDDHQYTIFNKGSVVWYDIIAEISVTKVPFISNYTITGVENCKQNNTLVHSFDFNCTFNLNSTNVVITVIVQIDKDKIVENLVDGKLKIESNVRVKLLPTAEHTTQRLITVINFQNEIKLSHNKVSMIIFGGSVALLILAVIIIVLYKLNFFKRKEKSKLDELKHEIRKQSIRRRASEINEPQTSSEEKQDDIFVDEDTYNDDVVLITSTKNLVSAVPDEDARAQV